MEGSIAASKRRAMPDMEKDYCIRSLSAPMRLSATGEVCSRFYITQGTTLTIGRSKKASDVVFDDARVSRQHCQLCLLPHNNTLLLLDGATTSGNGTGTYLDSHLLENLQNADVNRLQSLQQKYNGALGDGSRSKELKSLPEDFGDIQNARKLRRKARLLQHCKEKRSRMDSPPSRAIRHKPVKESSGPWKPSLNGIFVNGREFCARMMVLVPGDEVSLVGPTERGRSLDSDCPAAIGFVVEVRSMVEKPQPTIVQHTVGDNFSAPGMGCISHDVGDGSGSIRNALDNMQGEHPELLSVKLLHCNEVVNVHRHSMNVIPKDGDHFTESDTQTGDLSTKCSDKGGFADPVEKGNLSSVCSLDAQVAQVNGASSSLHLDDKLLSTLNLVKASMRLRSNLLNCSTARYGGEKEVRLTTAEIRVHSSKEISGPNMIFTDSTMPIIVNATEVCGSPFEYKKTGEYANKEEISFSLEHTVKVPIPAPLSKQDNLLKESSLGNYLSNDAGANSSQFTRTVLLPPISHKVIATDVLSQMLDAVLCETSVANYLAPCATNVMSLEGPVSGDVTKHTIGNLQTLTHQGVKDNTAEKGEPFHANDVGRMMVEAAKASLTVTQIIEELSEVQTSPKENIGALCHSDTGCIIEGHTQGQELKDESCRLQDVNEPDLLKLGKVSVHIMAEPKAIYQVVCCQSPPMDVGACECTSKGVGIHSGDGNFMALNSTLKTDAEIVSFGKAQGKVKCPDMQGVQRQEACAAQELGPQETACSLDRQQELQCTCTLGLSRTDVEVIATGLKQEDFCKKVDLKCTTQGKVEMVFKSSTLEAAPDKDKVFATLGPDPEVTHAVCKEQEWDNARSDDGVKLEADENFCRDDVCCNKSLEINVQVDRVVDLIASKETSGYYLNQLEDVTPRVSDHDSTVRLWDLLALTDDVQALFIATFTYDMEWFLSSAGLSCDTPVTVACHDAKRCWSRASKDRCEKPFLDWPNVTLVYPPFPRSNAFGSKEQGIGCHHPKIFLVRRSGSLRVIVSSANLTYKQWFHVTNNVWWQDFSCRQTPDFRCLFRGEKESKSSSSPDFASQLAMFLAALLVDAPSEAHWVTDLAAFDFSDAAGSLVASVPGLHQPLYHNAPQFLMTLDKEACYPSLQGDAFVSSYLGVVPTTVAGIKYRFCPSVDRNGTRIRCLAAALNDTNAYEESTMPVLLKRAKFLKADPNAVSVIVTSRAKGCNHDLFLQQDLHDAEINTMETDAFNTEEGFIKLGFLPRDVASWLAVLCDQGFFSFAACIWPSEALAAASGQRDGAVKLALYVFQGPKFSRLSSTVMTSKESGALSGLLKSLHNKWGLWRLEKVLCRYNWVDSCESDFYVASSSLGTSLDAKFLAAFAAAAGRRAESKTLSQESDPQWGCWTAEQEAANPSIGIVFPTIDRVRQDNFLHYGLLCFAESAWLRLKSAGLLHDAVPHPPEREGFPMHIKVARRRFRDPLSSQSYGWMYCGSHNFSPAAWGRPIWRWMDWEAATDAGSVLGSSLHICNYELGVVLMEPPPHEDSSSGKVKPDRRGLDRFVLPFKVPPPMYRGNDRPVTGRAMMEAYMEMRALQLKAAEEDVAVMQSEDLLEEAAPVQQENEAACDAEREEARAEQVYVEALWTQTDDEDERTNKE